MAITVYEKLKESIMFLFVMTQVNVSEIRGIRLLIGVVYRKSERLMG